MKTIHFIALLFLLPSSLLAMTMAVEKYESIAAENIRVYYTPPPEGSKTFPIQEVKYARYSTTYSSTHGKWIYHHAKDQKSYWSNKCGPTTIYESNMTHACKNAAARVGATHSSIIGFRMVPHQRKGGVMQGYSSAGYDLYEQYLPYTPSNTSWSPDRETESQHKKKYWERRKAARSPIDQWALQYTQAAEIAYAQSFRDMGKSLSSAISSAANQIQKTYPDIHASTYGTTQSLTWQNTYKPRNSYSRPKNNQTTQLASSSRSPNRESNVSKSSSKSATADSQSSSRNLNKTSHSSGNVAQNNNTKNENQSPRTTSKPKSEISNRPTAIVVRWKIEKSGKWSAVGPVQGLWTAYDDKDKVMELVMHEDRDTAQLVSTQGRFEVFTLNRPLVGKETDARRWLKQYDVTLQYPD